MPFSAFLPTLVLTTEFSKFLSMIIGDHFVLYLKFEDVCLCASVCAHVCVFKEVHVKQRKKASQGYFELEIK